MSMSFLTAMVLTAACLSLSARPAAGQRNPELLTQVQAADVLSDLITYSVARGGARVENVREFLRANGKEAAYEQAKPAAANPLLPFTAVFQGALVFVKGEGAKYVDPSLATLSDAQLSSELTELQVYNIQQFQKLNELAKQAASMKAYLQSAGELEKYRAWAKEKGFAAHGAPRTPEELAARMEQGIESSKEIAWAKAQARGMSRAEFDQRWAEQVKQYRDSVAQKVVGVRALAKSLTNPPPPPPPPPTNPQPPANAGPPPGLRGGPSLPPTVGSQYQAQNTASDYQRRNDELWNRFDDD